MSSSTTTSGPPTSTMTTTFDLDGLLDLWSRCWEPGPEAQRAFAQFYAEPVILNGNPVSLSGLVDRANALQAALADPHREVLTTMWGSHGLAVEFRITGRHVGPLATSAGVLPATGLILSLRVIDILTVTNGCVTAIAMVPDELAALAAAGVAGLSDATQSRSAPATLRP